MNEHRLTDRLTSYWDNLRKDKEIPDFSQFNSSAIDDLWQQCILFTVSPTTEGRSPSLNFYKIGDKLRTIYGQNAEGKTFNPAQRQFQGAAVVRKIDTVLANPIPLVDIGQFIGDNSKMVKYRSCLLPFGRDGVVTHVIAGISWREF
jgi:PAS domain